MHALYVLSGRFSYLILPHYSNVLLNLSEVYHTKRYLECFRLSHSEFSPWSMLKVFKIGDEYSTQQDDVATYSLAVM